MTEQRGINSVHKALIDEGDDVTADVRGDHYAKHGIDPWGYGMLAKLDPLQFSVVKYVTRFRDKGGLDDLRKAENALKRLIAFDYGGAVGE